MRDYWTAIDTNIGAFLATVRDEIARVDARSTLGQLSDGDLYIDQDVSRRLSDRYTQKRKRRRRESVNLLEVISSNPLVIIEGGMGSGKSKLIRHTVQQLCEAEHYLEHKLLPVYIPFQRLIDDYGSDLRNAVSEVVPNSVSEALHANEGRLAVFVDGFDEKNLAPDDQLKFLQELQELSVDDGRMSVVVATRFLSVLDDQPQNTGFPVFEIHPLSLGRLIKFLETICTRMNVHKSIVADLKKSQLFKELPRTPIAAILLARMLDETDRELPSNLTELFAKYTELVLGRWDIGKGLQSQQEYETLDHIMQELAEFMVDNDLLIISIGDFRSIIDKYLSARNLDIDANDLFRKATERCELIALDLPGNTVSFRHRSFAEFLYAKRTVETASHRLKIDSRAFEPFWIHTYFFYLGLLKDCPGKIRELTKLEPPSESHRWMRLIAMPDYLLASYATPYEVIEEAVADAALRAARLLQDLLDGKLTSLISRGPRMVVVYLFQLFMREGYSYKFFARSLEAAALLVDDADDPDRIKAFAMFFLNVAAIDSGAADSFDFLLKKYSSTLPRELTFALYHEGEKKRGIKRTRLLRKQEDRAKALFKDPKVRHEIETWYDKPVISRISKG